MKADQILSINKIKFDIIPTPKEYSSDCGLSVRINPAIMDMKLVESLLLNENLLFTIYDKDFL